MCERRGCHAPDLRRDYRLARLAAGSGGPARAGKEAGNRRAASATAGSACRNRRRGPRRPVIPTDMSWFDLPRVPEPEVMDDGAEVEAYASAAAQAYLSKLDDTLVDHAIRLLDRKADGFGVSLTEGRALDIGTGPGQIV